MLVTLRSRRVKALSHYWPFFLFYYIQLTEKTEWLKKSLEGKEEKVAFY